MYKYRLTKLRTYGTVARSGKVDDLYYFAQTDPDWAGEIFEFEGNGAMLKDRGCGCACAAMVFSTYHKVEITPRWMRTYALQDDYPVSCGLPNEYFEGIARYYKNLEYECYGTTLEVPTIYQKSAVDMSAPSGQTITLTKTASDWDGLVRCTATLDSVSPDADSPIYVLLNGAPCEACPAAAGVSLLAPDAASAEALFQTNSTLTRCGRKLSRRDRSQYFKKLPHVRAP